VAEKCSAGLELTPHGECFLFFLLIGSKMILESTSGKSDKKYDKSFHKNIKKNRVKITHKVMFVLAIATSIDALAAGFHSPSLSLIHW
jgi:putative Mn2+ efflux pump MntP